MFWRACTGAQVTMTLLSPNHLIRQSEPPTQTFVHEKNEVYNWAAYNQTNKLSAWPHGGNLSTRVQHRPSGLCQSAAGSAHLSLPSRR